MTTPTAAIKLTLVIHGGAPRAIEAGPVVLVGSGRGADVRVPDPAIAPLHLRLERAGDGVVALAAVVGVAVDGAPLAIDEPVAVAGRTITIGPLMVVAVPWQAASAPVATDSLARELMRDLLGGAAPPAPELVVERGPGAGALRPVPAGSRIVVGRGADADWVILDPELSRAHVGFAHREDGVYAWDAGGKNGAVVDGVALPRTEPGRLLAEGARIELGSTVLRLRDPAAPALAELERGLAAGRGSSAQAAVATVTRDLRRPAAARPPAAARARWPLLVTAVSAVAAVVLAVLVIATW